MNTRSLKFKEHTHNRYWWHRTPGTDYIPMLYEFLDETEWEIMQAWFTDTEEKYESTGEANIPPLSLLFGLISGNGMARIVQCGHFVGYSTLLIGFLLRRMGKKQGLFSIDIDAAVTDYTGTWISKAGLDDFVHLAVADSADAEGPGKAMRYFGDLRPQLVFIDSSHQYEHTLKELELWYDALPLGGLLALHDTSRFAATFDATGQGGVFRAVSEWCAVRGLSSLMLNSFVSGGAPGDYPYLDGCGLTLIQKSR